MTRRSLFEERDPFETEPVDDEWTGRTIGVLVAVVILLAIAAALIFYDREPRTVAAAEAIPVPEFVLAAGESPDVLVATKTSEVGSYDWSILATKAGTDSSWQTGYSGGGERTIAGLTVGTYEVRGRNRLRGVYSPWGPAVPWSIDPPDDRPGYQNPPGWPEGQVPSEMLGVSVWTETDVEEGTYQEITVGPDYLYLRRIDNADPPDSLALAIRPEYVGGFLYVTVRPGDAQAQASYARSYRSAPAAISLPATDGLWYLRIEGIARTADGALYWQRIEPWRGGLRW